MVYFVFDLLYLDGYDLRGVALAKRRELLEQIVTPGRLLRISEAFPGAGEEMLEAARENGLEGIARQARASSLLRIEPQPRVAQDQDRHEQEFVIGGFTEPQGDRVHFGALVLGVYEDGKLQLGGQRRHRLRPEDARRTLLRA